MMTFNYLKSGLLITLLVLGGCESQQSKENVSSDIEDALDDAIQSNQPSNALPGAVTNALLPAIDLTTTKLPEMTGDDKCDISVSEVPADQFFLSLVDGTPFNIVIHPEVEGTITVNLKDVTIPQVLEAVRDVYGYEFVSTEYGFQVLPGRMQAKIFQINYLNIQRTGRSSTLVSSGALSTGSNSNAGGTGGTSGSSSGASQSRPSTVFGTEIRTEQPEIMFLTE